MAMRYEDQPQLGLLVSEAERARVVEELQRRCVAGYLNFDQLALRARAAYAARTRDELAAAAGTPLPAAPAATPAPPPTWAPAPVPSWVPLPQSFGRSGVASWVVSIMGSVTRKGGWRVADQNVALAVMGSCELDLRQAILNSPEPQITALACLGSVTVIVPEGMQVEVSGIPLMGSVDCRTSDVPPPPNGPVIRLRVIGLACLGAVTVKSRPGQAAVLAPRSAW